MRGMKPVAAHLPVRVLPRLFLFPGFLLRKQGHPSFSLPILLISAYLLISRAVFSLFNLFFKGYPTTMKDKCIYLTFLLNTNMLKHISKSISSIKNIKKVYIRSLNNNIANLKLILDILYSKCINTFITS